MQPGIGCVKRSIPQARMSDNFNPPAAIVRRPCLLLVDDTPANIDILVGLLKAEFDLKIANRGEKALQICCGPDPIDLILLDVMMPSMDGFEVCRVLRGQASTQDIPILFLTAKAEVEDVIRGFGVGGNDYLTKPFRPEELLARVRTHLTLRSQQVEIRAKSEDLKEMLHIVCHDVANHFSVLNLSMDFVESEPDVALPRYLPLIRAALRNGIRLTEMVREMRRSEDKSLALVPVDVESALRESLLLVQGKLEGKNLTCLLSTVPIQVIAEPCALVNSVFNNILTNAIKFSHDGGRIEIEVTTRDGMVCIRFRDHGVGMPPTVLQHVFDMGRSHSRPGTSGERGTGFGMPLMRRFVTQFGGRVELDSHEAGDHPDQAGTEFRVWLQAGS